MHANSLAYDGSDVFNEKGPRVQQEHLVAHENDDGVESLKAARQRVFHVKGVTEDVAALGEKRRGNDE